MTEATFEAGNPELFAIKLEFKPDPDSGKAATKEDALSWGALQIWVSGKNLCLYQSGQNVHRSCHWYLLPIFEWLADNWDPLFHEERLPSAVRGSDARTSYLEAVIPNLAAFDDDAETRQAPWEKWWDRHALRAHRDGGILPDLFLRRWRDLVEFSWGSSPSPGTPENSFFLAPNGIARLDVYTVAQVLYNCLDAVSTYLLSHDQTSGRLQSLSHKKASISTTDLTGRSAWLASLGTSLERSNRCSAAAQCEASRAAQNSAAVRMRGIIDKPV